MKLYILDLWPSKSKVKECWMAVPGGVWGRAFDGQLVGQISQKRVWRQIPQ